VIQRTPFTVVAAKVESRYWRSRSCVTHVWAQNEDEAKELGLKQVVKYLLESGDLAPQIARKGLPKFSVDRDLKAFSSFKWRHMENLYGYRVVAILGGHSTVEYATHKIEIEK